VSDGDEDTLALVGEELSTAFGPLERALASPDALADLLRELGWDTTGVPQPVQDLGAAVQDVVATLAAGVDADSAPALLAKIARLIEQIDTIAAAPAGALPVPDPAAFAAEFPEQLLKHLIATYLIDHRPLFAGLLSVLGLMEDELVPAAGTRLAYRRLAFEWERVPDVLADPLGSIASRYAWGATDVEVARLHADLGLIATGLGLKTRRVTLDDASARFLAGGVADPDDRYRLLQRWYLLETEGSGGSRGTFGVGLAGTPPPAGGKAGVAFMPFAAVEFQEGIELAQGVDVVFEAEASLDGGIALLLHPERPISIAVNLFPTGGGAAGQPPLTAAVAAGFEHHGEGRPVVVLGSSPGSRLEYGAITIVAGGRLGAGGQPSAFVEARLRDAAAVIQPAPGDTDSFLARLLPGDGFRLGADLEIGLDSLAGLYFKGSAGLEIRYPTHLSLGIVELLGLTVAVRPDPAGPALPISLGADIKGLLGPLTAVAENVGMTARLDFGAAERNLGIADLTLGFKPPNGVGLALDAGVVKGGGYLFLDFEKGEYAGALELTISNFLSLRAIGLITTRLPDGSPGFSLLIILTAEFQPGLQLGFGFSLIGVGGLVGLNRTMLLEPLAQGVRTGAVNSVLFPHDVVANAPRIISDLRAIFPPQQGRFLIGPMAKLGWGTPTLVSLSLGVIIEIPGNVVILGVLRLALPTADKPLIQLQVSFVGALEFDRKRIWFFASLFDSRVLTIPLDGEMGLLMAYGDEPNFVLAVGGFHPRFTPPPLPFPAPRRISVAILNEANARILAEGYFAVTSNTAQFGARAELFFGMDAFSVSGHLSFDALFRFSPFSFLIEVGASVSLKAFGVGMLSIRLEFALEGPAPWRARGRGSIRLLFFEISAEFDITWGEGRDTTLPPISVMPLLKAEVEKSESWKASLPPGGDLLVTLRPQSEGADALIMHPLGTLRVSQRGVPLQLALDRIGSQRPSDVRKLGMAVAGAGMTRVADVSEQFALAQFKDLSDGEKLTRRAFEPQPAGVELAAAGAQLVTPRAVRRVVRYEQIIVDSFYKRRRRRLTPFAGGLFRHFLAENAASVSVLSEKHRTEVQPFDDVIQVDAEEFAVAGVLDNVSTAYFASEALAVEHLEELIAADPARADELHVIPAFEAAG
jgi:hypothetical protein